MRKQELAEAFVSSQAFKWNPAGFRLASGVMSPYYVECRALMAHPGPRQLVAALAYDALAGLELDCLGGLEIGAIPIATAISDHGYRATSRREWRTFVVRKQMKDHGLGKQIEGAVRPGDRALVVDDVLTSGGSVLKAVAAAREAGLKVEHALVLVDREEQDGRKKIESEGITLISLLSIKDLMEAQRDARD
jgi:orotate phosphoribosyltransferase